MLSDELIRAPRPSRRPRPHAHLGGAAQHLHRRSPRFAMPDTKSSTNAAWAIRLLTRPLTDEEIIRLHGMVMRNRSTPIAIRKSMAQHLVAMASADVRGYLDTPEPAPSAGSKATRQGNTSRPSSASTRASSSSRPSTTEPRSALIFRASLARGEIEVARMTLRPFAIRQRDGISYLLGTVYDARGADDTLRTVEIGRMRNVTTRLLDGKKLFRRPGRGGQPRTPLHKTRYRPPIRLPVPPIRFCIKKPARLL